MDPLELPKIDMLAGAELDSDSEVISAGAMGSLLGVTAAAD